MGTPRTDGHAHEYLLPRRFNAAILEAVGLLQDAETEHFNATIDKQRIGTLSPLASDKARKRIRNATADINEAIDGLRAMLRPSA